MRGSRGRESKVEEKPPGMVKEEKRFLIINTSSKHGPSPAGPRKGEEQGICMGSEGWADMTSYCHSSAVGLRKKGGVGIREERGVGNRGYGLLVRYVLESRVKGKRGNAEGSRNLRGRLGSHWDRAFPVARTRGREGRKKRWGQREKQKDTRLGASFQGMATLGSRGLENRGGGQSATG